MFNMQRFLRLAKAQWVEHRKTYAWFFAIGIIVHFCTLLAFSVGGGSLSFLRTEMQMVIYMVGLFITGPLFAGRYFEKMSARDSALTILMRPASKEEKFLLAFIFIALLYPMFYTLAYQINNLPASWMAMVSEHYQSTDLGKYDTYWPLLNSKERKIEFACYVLVWTLQGFMLAGTLFFKRFAMLKSIVLGFILFLGLVFFGVVSNAKPDRLFYIWDSERFIPSGFFWWLVALWILVPLLTWLSAYFFFKERELH
jgi:hypothetical protein